MVESHAFIFVDTMLLDSWVARKCRWCLYIVLVYLRATREFTGTWSPYGMHHWCHREVDLVVAASGDLWSGAPRTTSLHICWLYGGMILEVRECGSDANTEIQLPAIYWKEWVFIGLKGGRGVVGVWAPSRRGEGDWISTRRRVGRGSGA